MSEISGLSNQYEKLSIASENFNDAVIILKKKRLLTSKKNRVKYPKLSISDEDISNALIYINKFLKGIKEGVDEGLFEKLLIPASILEEYKEKIEAIDPYILEDIPTILALLESTQELEDEHFNTLENLLTALDFERTAVFKKLRAGRV